MNKNVVTLRKRTARPIDGSGQPHVFVECRPDCWVEFNRDLVMLNRATADLLADAFVSYDSRAFEIGLVNDWVDDDPVQVVE